MLGKYFNVSLPIILGEVRFKNRMFSAPMRGTDITDDGCIDSKATAFYELRRKGGAGAISWLELSYSDMYVGNYMTNKKKQKMLN